MKVSFLIESSSTFLTILMDLLVDKICDAELEYKAEEISLQWNLDPISSS